LQTYGRAELSVELNGETIMQWQRNDDKDPAKLIVNGNEIEDSNVKAGEDDYTPEPQKTKIELKKGDKPTLKLNGNFGNADSYLRLIAPGLPGDEVSENADENADGKIKEWRDSYANGNRMHIFLKRRGEAYGGPATIEFGLKSGARLRWRVADGARRTEK
jgi:uncharacterized membrane protein YkoI